MDLELYKALRDYILDLMKTKRANLSPKDLSQLLKKLRQLR